MYIDILLRSKYDKNFPKLDQFYIIIKDRFKKEVIIDGKEINEIKKDHFTLLNGKYIPAHRILKIKKKAIPDSELEKNKWLSLIRLSRL